MPLPICFRVRRMCTVRAWAARPTMPCGRHARERGVWHAASARRAICPGTDARCGRPARRRGGAAIRRAQVPRVANREAHLRAQAGGASRRGCRLTPEAHQSDDSMKLPLQIAGGRPAGHAGAGGAGLSARPARAVRVRRLPEHPEQPDGGGDRTHAAGAARGGAFQHQRAAGPAAGGAVVRARPLPGRGFLPAGLQAEQSGHPPAERAAGVCAGRAPGAPAGRRARWRRRWRCSAPCCGACTRCS